MKDYKLKQSNLRASNCDWVYYESKREPKTLRFKNKNFGGKKNKVNAESKGRAERDRGRQVFGTRKRRTWLFRWCAVVYGAHKRLSVEFICDDLTVFGQTRSPQTGSLRRFRKDVPKENEEDSFWALGREGLPKLMCSCVRCAQKTVGWIYLWWPDSVWTDAEPTNWQSS